MRSSLNTSHAKLLKQSSHHNQQAFKQLYDATSPCLYGLSLRMLGKNYLAEECLQEAYLKIWQKAATFDNTKSCTFTWMYTVTKNTALDKLRSHKSRPQQSVIDEYDLSMLCSQSLMPDSEAAINEEMRMLLKSLTQMNPMQRECLLLFCCYGHTHKELAKKLDIPLGTIKAWIRRGKKQLRLANTKIIIPIS